MNQTAYPEYGELYVISDLHLGGEPGMQIFCKGNRLKNFLVWLKKEADKLPQGKKLALVLAGDVIDTLPYYLCSQNYISIDNAVCTLNKIMDDDSFKPFFDGLSIFVLGKKCELVILTGNHDLELALPSVQEKLLLCIARLDDAARGRVRFFTQGTGFRCMVDKKRFLLLMETRRINGIMLVMRHYVKLSMLII